MGILGGEKYEDRLPDTRDPNTGAFRYGDPIPGQSEFELHTDIDVTFTMTGQTDTGLTFGASIDLDESDGSGSGNDAEGASGAFDNRKQGGEEIFISGAFGTLTMGDTDGALDWALQDIGIGNSLGDVHTSHHGYLGNDFGDGGRNSQVGDPRVDNGDGQIARYDHSFGDFAIAFSADIAEAEGDDILAAGAKYSFALPAMRLGVGVGWQQRIEVVRDNPGGTNYRTQRDATGISLDAEFDNGFRTILNWADLGYSYLTYDPGISEKYEGIGLAYTMEDWTFAANYGRRSTGPDYNGGQNGIGVAVNYDLGGGAEMQLGYHRTNCKPFNPVSLDGSTVTTEAIIACGNKDSQDAFSFGVAMNF